MIVKLPGRVDKRITDEYGAYIKKGILYLPQGNFEEVMKALTYQIKGNQVCYFCGTSLTKDNRTLDHLYPRDYGGITVPNNLVPCCKTCNSEKKRNLNEIEYRRYSEVKNNPQLAQEFWREYYARHECDRRNLGVTLPHDWYTLKNDFSVLALVKSDDKYKKSRQYIRINELYEMYNRICKPVVITRNNVVVDGILALMFAKNLQEKVEIPFVILENGIAI